MMKNKIAFFLPSLNIGGIERVFLCYANNIVKRGYNVDFVVCKREGLLLADLSPRVNLVNLGDIQLRKSLFSLRKYLKEYQPDVVMTGGDYPNIMLIFSSLGLHIKSKIVISQHNFYNIEVRDLGLWARATLIFMRIFYPLADRIIAISDGISSFLVGKLNLSPDKVIRICNPIDITDVIAKSNQVPSVSLPDNYIVFIGRISAVKNLNMLLQAFDIAKIGDTCLVIVGDGKELSLIQQRILMMSKKDKVFCVGGVSNPLPILKKSRLLALPSFSEAFPTILLEAMCLNKPIVATPTKGALEILQGIDGTFISAGFDDAADFSALIEKAVCVMDIDMSQYVKKYSSENIVEDFLNKIL
ncbi:glycosyltransferase [Phocaeicola barnesiae]|uniref:Glycosyltransferase n=1 Tax=Phocaeicola barnesiae TaxID=376804 RepID=A0AAW5MX32_9BACT|nr:glycosyltransferase [Phocaeicola barnesiae]MCR8872911.1 glycosyltransferase [Phocaeicola barnesiae]